MPFFGGGDRDGDDPRGCGLPPGTTWALVLVLLWIMFVVPAYERWRYGEPKPPQDQGQLQEEGRRQGQDRPPHRPGVEPQEGTGQGSPAGGGGEAPSAGDLVPGQSAAEALAARAGDLPGDGTAGASEAGPEEKPEPEPEPEAQPEAKPETIRVETDELIVELSTLGASIERAWLRGYHSTPRDTEPLPILMPLRGTGGGANSFVLRPARDIEGRSRGVDLSRVVWKLEEDSGLPGRA